MSMFKVVTTRIYNLPEKWNVTKFYSIIFKNN